MPTSFTSIFVIYTFHVVDLSLNFWNEQKRLKTVKKVFQPAFRSVHHPEAGQNTQKMTYNNLCDLWLCDLWSAICHLSMSTVCCKVWHIWDTTSQRQQEATNVWFGQTMFLYFVTSSKENEFLKLACLFEKRIFQQKCKVIE